MIQFDNAVRRYNEIILSELKEAEVNCWLAGGAIRDYFMGVKITTDYDLFFPNEIEYDKAKKYLTEQDSEIIWESDNGCKIKYKNRKFDLVKKFFSSPENTIKEFDFTVSMFAVNFEKVFHGESSFIDLAKKQLMINKITYPASTLSRAFRYHKKGFNMCQGEMKKLFESIQKQPIEVVKEETTTSNTTEPTSGDLAGFFLGID